ncbi:MAG: hypothetical protein ACK5WY_06805, partial [Holosporaceae bacterium]
MRRQPTKSVSAKNDMGQDVFVYGLMGLGATIIGGWVCVSGMQDLGKIHPQVRNDIPAERKSYEKKLNNDLPAEWKSFYTDQANLAVAYEAIRKKYETVEKNIDEHPELVDKLFKQLDETQLALDNKSIQEIRDQQGV